MSNTRCGTVFCNFYRSHLVLASFEAAVLKHFYRILLDVM